MGSTGGVAILTRYFHGLFARAERPGGHAPSAALRAAVERVIDGVDPRLRAEAGTLNEQLALVAAIMEAAPEHLRIERVSLTLDLMNVKVPRGSPASAETMTFNEMHIGAGRCMTLEMIRFPSAQLQSQAELRGGIRWAW